MEAQHGVWVFLFDSGISKEEVAIKSFAGLHPDSDCQQFSQCWKHCTFNEGFRHRSISEFCFRNWIQISLFISQRSMGFNSRKWTAQYNLLQQVSLHEEISPALKIPISPLWDHLLPVSLPAVWTGLDLAYLRFFSSFRKVFFPYIKFSAVM